ncbi:endonuclease/exonuclease/phosphatase family protein [Exiguobacterium chiriqhucha]|uniref:endonuclease/exonuclease/phosphatase family protein n=1 Tax=Exiguobacterium chiriqhucha TaxID=1385984 RepID=UPI0009E82A8D|nr:endonuclease/exonuclease/phosphatase family protein [Exiguobacterium chiriqhucha]
MRIATFNIWNNPTCWSERIESICATVKAIDADILALQEVKTYMDGERGISVAEQIANETGYRNCVFLAYPDSPDEGLAILSNIPLDTHDAIWHHDVEEANYCAMRVTFQAAGHTFGLTNVHLNWRSPDIRAAQVRAVREWVGAGERYELLCGDFNDDPQSEIHRDLVGHRWMDVAMHGRGGDEPTLDYRHNPYLKQDALLKRPSRYDWMLLHHDEEDAPPVLNVDVFGKTSVTNANVVPSDHYGVLFDLDIS